MAKQEINFSFNFGNRECEEITPEIISNLQGCKEDYEDFRQAFIVDSEDDIAKDIEDKEDNGEPLNTMDVFNEASNKFADNLTDKMFNMVEDHIREQYAPSKLDEPYTDKYTLREYIWAVENEIEAEHKDLDNLDFSVLFEYVRELQKYLG